MTIEADNGSIRFVDRKGDKIGSMPTSTFFQLPQDLGFAFFDSSPRVLFDTLHQRWVATEVSWDCQADQYQGDSATFGHGYLNFAISDTADPEGTWTNALLFYSDKLPGDPEVGMSTDKLGLSATVYSMISYGSGGIPTCIDGATFHESDLFAMDWSQLGPRFDPAKVALAGEAIQAPDVRVAVQAPVSAPELRVVYSFNNVTPADVIYGYISGSVVKKTAAFNAYDMTADNVVAQFEDAPAPHQPGGTLTAAPSSVADSLVYHAGTLAFTAPDPCTPTGDSVVRDCIRVVTLGNSNGTVEPTELGDTLLGTNGFDDSYGGIAFAGNDVLHAVYTQSSATSDASSYAQYNRPIDTPLMWSSPQLLTAGAAAYTPGPWAGYDLISADPQDPTAVWAGDPWANGSGGWATTVHELTVGADGAGYTPISPVRVLDTRSAVGLSQPFATGVPRVFAVGGFKDAHGVVQIPTDAMAITGNLTVTGQTGAGYVSLTPTANPNPASSTLNFPLGDTRANNATIALARDGTLAAVFKGAGGTHTSLILDVTGYFEIGHGQGYTPVAPTRVLDTRPGGKGLTGPFLANVPRSFVVTDGATIPLDATAITGNLTVVGQTRAGYVSVTPTPDPTPGTSTINFPLGDIRANGLTIPINPADGTVSAVYKAQTGATTHLILDVTGYYAVNDGDELHYHPLNPGRLVDTRRPYGIHGYGNVLSGAQGTILRDFPVNTHFGIDEFAGAITGNLTITGQTAAGYLALNDANAIPSTSTINFPLGDTRANGITVPIGLESLWLVYQGKAGKQVQVILDVTGYFR